jgi:hypothetical protein
MQKALLALACLFLMAGVASAQSSGNFSYAGENFVGCTVDSNSGQISGGYQCQSQCTLNPDGTSNCTAQSGDCMGNAVAGIKTSSGNGNVFVVRPSALVALLTDVTVSNQQKAINGAVSSSAYSGVDFQVSVTGPGSPQVIPSGWVTYDARYIQISTNLFQGITNNCLAVNGGCFLTFNESTASAHSFDWLVKNLQSGTYTVTTSWKDTTAGSGISQSVACVGPLNMTVQQNKVFSFNTPGGVVPINTP